MKYRTNQYVPDNKGTKFSTKTMTYKLDEVTGRLIEAGEVDDQELIQSYEDCALDKVLERFGYYPEEMMNIRLPQKYFEEEEEEVDMFPNSISNLRAQADVAVEAYRQEYGLDPRISANDVVKTVLDVLQNKMKEVEDGTQNDGTQEQTSISQHSDEDTSSQP